MPRYDHLQLLRLPEKFERRKRPGFGSGTIRTPAVHAAKVKAELDQAIDEQKRRRPPEFVNPSLILRVQMTGALLEEDWNRAGLTVLSSDEDRTLVLFSSTDELSEFRRRIDAYSLGTPPDKKGPAYAAFIGGVETIGIVEPRDRLGIRVREQGFSAQIDFQLADEYTIDIELWDLGRRDLRETKLNQIVEYIVARGGEELDRYIGPSITLVRVRCAGAVVQTLLTFPDVAELDFPPSPDITTSTLLDLNIAQLPELPEVQDDAPLIGIIDSGVNDHPLIADSIAGAIGVPESLGTADDFGHGTRVAGVAVFGDLRAQLASGTLNRGVRLCSAKVVDGQGRFPDRRLTAGQMREAVTRLNREFGCRIFVIALGDRSRVYDGGKVGVWAATLDELVAELDIVIVVSAGNRDNIRSNNQLEQAVTEYPRYLIEPSNKLVEPAGAINVITVGSLAHGQGMSPDATEAGVMPITEQYEPSPFTRSGPGALGATKPDFVDIGGTLVYDPLVRRLRDGRDIPEAGIISLYFRPVDRLFSACSGTSFAAPMVALKAAQIAARYPNASANLIRALLASGATVPPAASARLAMLGDKAERAICGHGVVNSERSIYSDDARVAFYAVDELDMDHFAVYQIPIPQEYQTERGRRTIKVSLAFDPPVRHSRRDYSGSSMSFRLIRGCEPRFIFEHFRKRAEAEGRFPEMAPRFNCDMTPSPAIRDKGSLQSATASFQKDISRYGDSYFLVVRCEGGWSPQTSQSYAVIVEIAHEADLQLYARLNQRIRLPA